MFKLAFLCLAMVYIPDANQCEEYLSHVKQYHTATNFDDEIYESMGYAEFVDKKKLFEKVDFSDYDQHFLNAALFYLTNDYRLKKRKKELRFEKRLRDASFIHAYEMMSKGFFSHTHPTNFSLRLPENRCKFCHYSYKASAENIARVTLGIETEITYLQLAKKLLDIFTNSSTHQKNILSSEYTEYGCTIIISEKIFKGGTRDIYAVQDFGEPTTESLDLEK